MRGDCSVETDDDCGWTVAGLVGTFARGLWWQVGDLGYHLCKAAIKGQLGAIEMLISYGAKVSLSTRLWTESLVPAVHGPSLDSRL